MPGLAPGIHVFERQEGVDGRDKFTAGPAQPVRAKRGPMTGSGRARLPGHDETRYF